MEKSVRDILSYICYEEVWSDSLHLLWRSLVRHLILHLLWSFGQMSYICYGGLVSDPILHLLSSSLVRQPTLLWRSLVRHPTFVMEKSGQTSNICYEVWSDNLYLFGKV